jgi:hypothetical protein
MSIASEDPLPNPRKADMPDLHPCILDTLSSSPHTYRMLHKTTYRARVKARRQDVHASSRAFCRRRVHVQGRGGIEATSTGDSPHDEASFITSKVPKIWREVSVAMSNTGHHTR